MVTATAGIPDLDTGFIQKLRRLQNPICGAFLRCALLARLPIFMICLRSLRCYALNCIHIWGFAKVSN